MKPSAQRVASRYMRRASSSQIRVKGNDRRDYIPQVWDMFEKTYRAIGMPVKSPEGLLKYPIWDLYFHEETPVMFNLYKDTPFGLKSGLSGSDGSSEGKRAVVDNLRSKFKQSGYYGEVSHKVEAIAIAAGAPVVCATFVAKILGKPVQPVGDSLHYERNLDGVGSVTKIMVGKPKGVPTTDYKNPDCPVGAKEGSPGYGLSDIDPCDHVASLIFEDAD